MVQPLWKIVWQVLKWLNKALLKDPAILPLGFYPREMNTDIFMDTCSMNVYDIIIVNSLIMMVKR